jgi:hypothetical protein
MIWSGLRIAATLKMVVGHGRGEDVIGVVDLPCDGAAGGELCVKALFPGHLRQTE